MKRRSEIWFRGADTERAYTGPKWLGLLIQLRGAPVGPLANFFKRKPNTATDPLSIPLPVRSNVYKGKIQNQKNFPRRQQTVHTLLMKSVKGLSATRVPCASMGTALTHQVLQKQTGIKTVIGTFWMVLGQTPCFTKFFSTALQCRSSQHPWTPSPHLVKTSMLQVIYRIVITYSGYIDWWLQTSWDYKALITLLA